MDNSNNLVFEIKSDELGQSVRLVHNRQQRFEHLLMRVLVLWDLKYFSSYGFFYFLNDEKVWIDMENDSAASLWKPVNTSEGKQSNFKTINRTPPPSPLLYLSMPELPPASLLMSVNLNSMSPNELAVFCGSAFKYLTLNRSNEEISLIPNWNEIYSLNESIQGISIDAQNAMTSEYKLVLLNRQVKFLNLIGRANIDVCYLKQTCQLSTGKKKKFKPIEIILSSNKFQIISDFQLDFKNSISYDNATSIKGTNKSLKMQINNGTYNQGSVNIELLFEKPLNCSQFMHLFQILRDSFLNNQRNIANVHQNDLGQKNVKKDHSYLENICELQKALQDNQKQIEDQKMEIHSLKFEKDIIKEMQMNLTEVFEERLENLRREVMDLKTESSKKSDIIENLNKRVKSLTVTSRRHTASVSSKPAESSETPSGSYLARKTDSLRRRGIQKKKESVTLPDEVFVDSQENKMYSTFLNSGECGSIVGY